MKRKSVIGLAALALAVPLLTYVDLSVSAHRLITPVEFAKFSNAIARSAIHPHEGGASHARRLAKQALSTTVKNGSIENGGQHISFPLPHYAIPQESSDGRFRFLAFVTEDEMEKYFSTELAQAGWKQVDQMGASHLVEGHGVHLNINQHFYLTSEISEFTVVANDMPGTKLQ
jgi:hypothetical protein